MSNSFLNLVQLALPQDITTHELIAMLGQEWYDKNPHLTIAYALRHHPRIDWQAYLEAYPEAVESGLDACLYFLRYGLYDDHKIMTRHQFFTPDENSDNPLVTIAIIADGNDDDMEQSLASARAQTEKNIEILIAPQSGSSFSFKPSSKEIPIKIIRPEETGTLSQYRALVEAARGRYVLFVESPDLLAENCCEEIIKNAAGRDIIEFKVKNQAENEATDEAVLIKKGNMLKNLTYTNAQIWKGTFFDWSIDPLLFNKAFHKSLLKGAFAKMATTQLDCGASLYIYTVLIFYARNLKKIDLELHERKRIARDSGNCGNIATYADAWAETEKFLDENNAVNYKDFHKNYFAKGFLKAASANPAAWRQGKLLQLLKKFPAEPLLDGVIDNFSQNWLSLAPLVKEIQVKSDKPPRHIGIFYHRLSVGGIEKNIAIMDKFLTGQGYRVSLFLEETDTLNYDLSPDTTIYRIEPTSFNINDLEAAKRHTRSLNKSLAIATPDLMLYYAALSPALLTDIFTCYLNNTQIIVNVRGDYTTSLLYNYAPRTHQQVLAAYRCATRLTCLSKYSELYYRSMGINARYIPNPVAVPEDARAERKRKDLVVIGRLKDPTKQLRESLYIMKEVVKFHPQTILHVVSDFDTLQEQDLFNRLTYELGIYDNVQLTGWQKDPAKIYKKSYILLSTSIAEGFPNVISEAQANGVPCVMYDFPIMAAVDNASIIKVRQGDYRAAAAEVVSLMNDEERWKKLSSLAIEKMRRYPLPEVMQSWQDVIVNRDFPERKAAPVDYADTIRAIASLRGRTGVRLF